MDRPRGAGLGSVLAAHGHSVVAFDLRGHGESGPSAREGAQYTYDDYVLHDIPAIVKFVRESFPHKRTVVVGHSLGAQTTLAMTGVFPEKSPDAIVSIAGNWWFPAIEPDPWKRLKKAAALRTLLEISERWGYFDPRPFKQGTDALALPYVRQLWLLWSTNRFGNTDGSIDYWKGFEKIAIPVFSVAGDGDTFLAPPHAVERFLAPIADRHKTLHVVKKSPGHMGLVTHARSREVWEEIADWIDQLE